MRYIKRSTLSIALLSALSLAGCGGGASDQLLEDAAVNESNSTIATPEISEETIVTVERGPVLFAHVIDAQGVKGEMLQDVNGNPTNQYRFTLSPVYPITASGGYIDLDASNSLSSGDIAMGNLQLTTVEGDKITLASSFVQNSQSLSLLESLGFTYEQLTTQTPSSDLMIAALSDAIFHYAITNNITDLSIIALENLSSEISTRVSDYINSDQQAIELERDLITELGELVNTISAEEVEVLLSSESNLAIIQSSFEETPITPEVQELIAYSWNEEKMAKELYLNLYNALLAQGIEIKPFYNVATNSETQHQASMQALAEKYHLDILNLDSANVTYGFDADALNSVPNAAFSLEEIQSMYNDLWTHAGDNNITTIKALETACIVEVKDVEDLNASIDIATELNSMELVAAFENLRSGSYNHYWAFNDALIAQGVTEGCATLGAEFDQDYPQVPKGGTPSDAGANDTSNTDTTQTQQGARDGTGNQYGKLGLTPPDGGH